VLVAFMGPDGAGKSRLANQIASWLRWKLDARVSYFGSGDGPSSLARWPLKLGLRAALALRVWAPGRRGSAAPNGDDPGAGGRGAAREPGLARALWALVLALEKRQNLRRAWRARNRGIIVVCDRFPQNQVMGFNDGPLLHRWSRSSSGLLRALARWESAPYRWAEAHPPQLVIKLHVSPEVAVARKPEMRVEEIQRRIGALVSLRYPAGTRVVDLDADRRWEAVLLDCKMRVWESL
jgi:thymidylate kinase